MGLDVVEICMECEQRFGIEIPDAEAEQAATVGGLFELICKRLKLPHDHEQSRPLQRVLIPKIVAPLDQSGRDAVWATLVGIVTDRLQVEPYEVTYDAHWSRDLGAD